MGPRPWPIARESERGRSGGESDEHAARAGDGLIPARRACDGSGQVGHLLRAQLFEEPAVNRVLNAVHVGLLDELKQKTVLRYSGVDQQELRMDS